MRFLIAAALLSASAAPALAQSAAAPVETRIDASTSSCEQIRATIEESGAAIVDYSEDGANLFAKFVASSNQCTLGRDGDPRSVMAADGQCLLTACEQDMEGPGD